MTDSDYGDIIQQFLEKMAEVKASKEEYVAGLEEAAAEVDIHLMAAREQLEVEED